MASDDPLVEASRYHRAGDLDEAVRGLNDRGAALHQAARFDEALATFEHALSVAPRHVGALMNRAATLKALKRFNEALASYDQALAIDPRQADALNNRGNLLLELKQVEQALASYDRALAIDPNHSGAWMNRAGALRDSKRLKEALASCDRALAIQPHSIFFLLNRGTLLLDLRRFEEALADFERAFAIAPEHPHIFTEIADAALRICDWPRSTKCAEALKNHVSSGTSIISPLTLLRYLEEPPLQLQCSRTYLENKIPKLPAPIHKGRRCCHDKVRIAYLSSDFRAHAVSYLIAELFERHDRKRFELIGISFGSDDKSEMRARLIKACDQFHDVRSRDDREVAEMLVELEIDIAVDLNGHTRDERIGIFAHRPAPIQVSYLGYPGTTGADFIDYVIADEVVLPFDQQPLWTEKIVHLPECFQVNDRKRRIAEPTPTRKECGLPERGFVFCCFNNSYKITPPFFDIWMRLLDNVEGSVLWLARDTAAAERNLRREAAARGVDPVRIVFAEKIALTEHLARLRLPDLFLDTLPYNAGATASDALWAGLPVLTCLGKSFSGRMAASLLQAIGLPELVTKSLEEYEALALKLAREPLLLAGYRKRLEKNRLTTPLFDTDRFCRHLEQAYLTMLDIHDRGEEPRSFAVAPSLEPSSDGRVSTSSCRGSLEEAVRYHRSGHLHEAVPRYREVLRENPVHCDALHGLAMARFEQNEVRECQALLERLLALDPAHEAAHRQLGRVYQRLGREADALASFDRALALEPADVASWKGRAASLERLGRLADALQSHERVLAIELEHAETLVARGAVLHLLKRFDEALASFDQALALDRDHLDALYNRATVLLEIDRFAQALAGYDRVLAINQDHVFALNNRAIALNALGRTEEALASYDRALAIEPNSVNMLVNRGGILFALGRPGAALMDWERALSIESSRTDALNGRGAALLELKRDEEALATYDRALAIDPNHARAWNNRGNALSSLGRIDEAFASYGRALAIEPRSATFLMNRGLLSVGRHQLEAALVDLEGALTAEPEHRHALSEAANAAMRICDWQRWEKYKKHISSTSSNEKIIIDPFVLLHYLDDPSSLLQYSKKYLRAKIPSLPSPLVVERSRRRGRVRIAYLSADFREHATSYLTAELFERHDRAHFEVFGVSFAPNDDSDMRRRLAKGFDRFLDVRACSNLEVAKLMHSHEIDIALDLMGHTKNDRIGIFAHRPAPIQVSYLGFPGTTGADFIDYVIGDEIVLPFHQQPFWSEKIIHLPDCYQVNDAKRPIAKRTLTRQECGLPEFGFVFCCFNNNCKITPPVFGVWMRLLEKVEGSVLWLLRDNATAERNLRRHAAAQGIDPARLVFADRLPLAEHLARHRIADLFIDTLPVNAHTTGSDALWAGLPVLTCLGKSFAGRVAASLLHAVGLPELVTTSLEEYEALALKLAREPSLLRRYRKRLEKNRATAPLFDTDRFRRHLEAAYQAMLDIERRGERPRSFSVDPT